MILQRDLICTQDHFRPLRKQQQDIRLLTVNRGQHGNTLRCTLKNARLDHKLPLHYETVSYCWGDTASRDWIEVNGHIVNIPSSAAAAIRQVRLPDQDRVIWIDALCINQADSVERSAQVAQMGLIYTRASGNLIGLGHSDDDIVSKAVASLQRITARINQAKSQLHAVDRCHLLLGSLPQAWVPNDLVSSNELESLQPLFEVSWFHRLWVVQEAALALRNTCYWGNRSFRLEDALIVAAVYDGSASVTMPRNMSASGQHGLFGASFMWEYITPDYRLFTRLPIALTDFRYLPRRLSCSDPRDRVFAIVEMYRINAGLCTVPTLLTPDYDKSVAHVFRDATRYMLSEPNCEDRLYTSQAVLSHICHRSKADMTARSLPSWSCKWDREYDPSEDWQPLERTFRAGVNRSPKRRPPPTVKILRSEDPNELILEGFVVGTITRATSPATAELLEDPALVRGIIRTLLHAISKSMLLGTCRAKDPYSLLASILTAGSNGLCEYNFRDMTQKREGLIAFPQSIQDDGLFDRRHVPLEVRCGAIKRRPQVSGAVLFSVSE